jgi:hypothetical protein
MAFRVRLGPPVHPQRQRRSSRYPLVFATMQGLRVRSCLIDGEIVVTRPDGVACFDRLRSRLHDETAFVYAFDLLELGYPSRRRRRPAGRDRTGRPSCRPCALRPRGRLPTSSWIPRLSAKRWTTPACASIHAFIHVNVRGSWSHTGMNKWFPTDIPSRTGVFAGPIISAMERSVNNPSRCKCKCECQDRSLLVPGLPTVRFEPLQGRPRLPRPPIHPLGGLALV